MGLVKTTIIFTMENKAQVTDLQKLGYGIILFAIVIGVGITIISAFGTMDVTCDNEATTTYVTEEPGWLNSSGYTLAGASAQGFSNLSWSSIVNATDSEVIGTGNITVLANGVIYNATGVTWEEADGGVLINYSYSWTDNHNYDYPSNTCLNESGGDPKTPTGRSYTVMNAFVGYLGTGSGGIVSWIPIVIVLVIGMLFLGYFISRKNKQS